MSTCSACWPGHRVQAVELGFRRVGEQRSGAVDGEERAAGDLAGGRRRRSDAVAVDERAGRGGHAERLARETGRRRIVDVGCADAVGVGNDDRDRGIGVVAKSRRNWSPTWWAEAVVGSTRSSGNPQRTLRNGAPSNSSNATPAKPERNRFVHHAFRGCDTRTAARRGRLRFGAAEHAADEPADVERIQAIADQDEGGGCHHDRGGGGEGDGGDSGVRERLQEVHREQHQHHHRQRDRRGGEHHGSARRRPSSGPGRLRGSRLRPARRDTG